MNGRRYDRLRWAVRTALALGVTVSIAANVLHARDNLISQAIAGWPPIALLLTVELISRIPAASRGLAMVRVCATAIVAVIAAWVSYWHMVSVAARYGEIGASPYLLPLSVDGLIIVASICLVELSARLQNHEPSPAQATASPLPESASEGVSPLPDGDNAASTPPTQDDRAGLPGRAELAAACPPSAPVPQAPTSSPRPMNAVPPRQVLDAEVYQPVSEEDRAMYDAWLRAVAAGHRLSGAGLARAAGRSDDNTGVGRRAARRYGQAHAAQQAAPVAAGD